MPNPQSEPHPPPEQTQQARTRRCRHIFAAGRQCGSPCLRAEQFCYFHHTTRRPVSDPKARRVRATTYDLPVPEDRDSIRAAIAQVMHDIANNHIDLRRAGLILYSLQLALCALPKEPRMTPQSVNISAASHRASHRASNRNSSPVNEIPVEPIIEETVLDDNYGLIAPEKFLGDEEPENDGWEDPGDRVLEGGRLLRNTLGYKLLKDVELSESKTQGWYRGRVEAFAEAARTAAAAAAKGATSLEIAETLGQTVLKAATDEAAFDSQVAAGMAKSPFYTGMNSDDEDDDIDAHSGNAATYELEPWESPIIPDLNASAKPPFRHSRRKSAYRAASDARVPIHAQAHRAWVGTDDAQTRSSLDRCTRVRMPHPCAASSRMGWERMTLKTRSSLDRCTRVRMPVHALPHRAWVGNG